LRDATDNPLRIELTNELHARPFPVTNAPARIGMLAISAPDAANRDRGRDRDALERLLRHYAASASLAPGATHFFGQVANFWLKWESHTEFVAYTVFLDGLGERPFDESPLAVLPPGWLAGIEGECMASMLIRVEPLEEEADVAAKADGWFLQESLALSWLHDGEIAVASDFRLDPAGHVRAALFVGPDCGPHRVGRAVQRLTEIEVYTKMSLLGLSMARRLNADLNRIETDLHTLTVAMTDPSAAPEATLNGLLAVSAALEVQATQTSFRFGATDAYAAIVNQRLAVLRESRFLGRQTLGEFMARRWNPAMRTVVAAEKRLAEMTERGGRTSDLLRTRVDVERSALTQTLLQSMDRRAHLQLRLQQTVEGLSVVAISYYTLNLVLYLLGPLAETHLVSKGWLAAGAVPPVVLAVWLMVRRIRKSVH